MLVVAVSAEVVVKVRGGDCNIGKLFLFLLNLGAGIDFSAKELVRRRQVAERMMTRKICERGDI